MSAASISLSKATHYLELEALLDGWLSETEHSSSQYELIRINKTARDVTSYMSQLSTCVEEALKQTTDPEFFHESHSDITKMTEIMKKIDIFLRQAFSVVDENSHSVVTTLLQNATLLSMDTVKQITKMAKLSKKATALIEIRDVIMSELDKEVVECKRQLTLLEETPSPFQSADLPFESLSEYLSSTSLAHTQELFGNESTLLAFSKTEKAFYESINALEFRLEPMQFSVDLLKSKIAHTDDTECFEIVSKRISKHSMELEKDWSSLFADFILLKKRTLGAHLVCVFQYLNSQVLTLIERISLVVDRPDFDIATIGSDFKTCSAAINLIRKISASTMIGLEPCIHQYNTEISSKWNHLNEVLRKEQISYSPFVSLSTPKLAQTSHENLRLRSIKTARSITPSAEVVQEREPRLSTQTLGLGINLHLGVDPSPSVPFSISKSDRIIDLNFDTSCLPKSNFQLAMLRSAKEDINEQDRSKKAAHAGDQISLPSTPAMFSLGSPAPIHEVRTTETTPFYKSDADDLHCFSKDSSTALLSEDDKSNILKELRKHDSRPSRIPTIVSNYADLKLPVLRKNDRECQFPSRIPSISPDNEVFCSPERRTNFRKPAQSVPQQALQRVPSLKVEKPRYETLRSPPAFTMSQKPHAQQPRPSSKVRSSALGDVTNTVTCSTSVNAPAGELSLKGSAMPNLAYSENSTVEVLSPVSWRSTSPERPGSSMGSRFDEKHLTQPLKPQKKRWT